MNVPTPHNQARPGDIAKTVLMPGDPLRAKFIAQSFITDARLVNNVRGIQGYTGTYRGVPVSVMASGMGMPSMGIYSYELFNLYGVDNIIRVGSAGALTEKTNLRDIILAMGACTTSSYAEQYRLPGTFASIASFELLHICVHEAERAGLTVNVGNVCSTDAFYGDEDGLAQAQKSASLWRKMGVLCVEMEAAALYMNAARAGKRALAVMTVSDSLVTGESLSSAERQESFTDMMELALNTAAAAEKDDV